MSFYGNITASLSQAFSRFLFKNSGKNSQDFREGNDDVLDAEHSSASITFDSGNRWIQIQGDDDGCKIWHGAPVTDENDLTLVQGFLKTKEPTTPNHIAQLESGDCLQVPLLMYDSAGHVSTTGEAVYYRLPVIQIESDINEVKSQVKNMQDTISGQNSKLNEFNSALNTNTGNLKTLTENIGVINGVTGNLASDLSSAIGPVYSLTGLFGDDQGKGYLSLVDTIKTLYNTCNRQAEQINLLTNTVNLLSEKVNLLHPSSES